jgi:hypothetical protein
MSRAIDRTIGGRRDAIIEASIDNFRTMLRDMSIPTRAGGKVK